MRIKQIPADFVVEEQLGVALDTAGVFAIYRVEKQGITTQQVKVRLATKLNLQHSAVRFPALKDRRAVTTQYLSIRGNPPASLRGQKWTATHAGRLARPLSPPDIVANRFTLTLRDLSLPQAEQVTGRLQQLAEHGLPNYFDQQRFGSFHPQDGFIGKHIVQRNEKAAVRAYLSVAYPADPPEVKRFKKVAAAHWGDWETLFAAAPRPSNLRSLLTYLRDHPQNYRRALNLIPQSLLSLFLSAYQSSLWNRIAGRYLERSFSPQTPSFSWLEIAGDRLPIYQDIPASLRQELSQINIVMPHHRAVYREPTLAAAAKAVLQAEGLAQNDLKARILKKAYLSKHQRPLLLPGLQSPLGAADCPYREGAFLPHAAGGDDFLHRHGQL